MKDDLVDIIWESTDKDGYLCRLVRSPSDVDIWGFLQIQEPKHMPEGSQALYFFLEDEDDAKRLHSALTRSLRGGADD